MAKELILKKKITMRVSTEKVWNVLTNPDLIKSWLFGTNVVSDWIAGGNIRFTGEWNRTEYEDKGVILKIEEERILEYNYWSQFSGLPDLPENYSVITFMLKKKKEFTELHLSHANFATKEMQDHSEKNWDEALKQIKIIAEKI